MAPTKRAAYGTRARVGARIGRLTIVEIVSRLNRASLSVVVRCHCGTMLATTTALLRVREHLKRKRPGLPPISCGCAKNDGEIPGRHPWGLVPVDG